MFDNDENKGFYQFVIILAIILTIIVLLTGLITLGFEYVEYLKLVNGIEK